MRTSKKLSQKIKERYKKAYKKLRYSKYVSDYLFTSNIRSSIYLGIMVAVLEIWMLISVISGAISSDGEQGFIWVLQHTYAYIALLVTALLMLVYSVLYLKGKIKNQLIGHAIKIFFTIIGITFGLYISYISYDPSGKVFAFVTMEVFCIGLLIWQPVVTFFIITASFSTFLYLHNLKTGNISYSIWVNSFTLWLAMLMAGINIHHQRRVEAQKDENLEKMAEYMHQKSLLDELTGLSNMYNFQHMAAVKLQNKRTVLEKLRFIYMDIENFKNYNEKYGFRSGNNFLRTIGQFISQVFEGELVARFSDDHFVALVSADGLEFKLAQLKNLIREREACVQLGFKTGVYAPLERTVSPSIALDHARYACASIKKHYKRDVAEYNDSMDKEFRQKKYVINNLDEAIEKGWIQVYYQPVVWAESGKLCGVEALARWNDPQFGFLSPNAFVPVLEEYHLIHKLDMCILRQACQSIQLAYKEKEAIIPVSINFSRLDFEILDPLKEIDACIKEYGIEKDDIHVEITESALSDTDTKLKSAMNSFRKAGYSLWLDDFGSGYSGLNVLKDFSFDMMKIDMKFLSRFSDNQKTRPILTSIVALAQKIGMQTLTEGVETPEAYEFLRSIGCQRLQGYLFGKPMTQKELHQKIKAGVYDVSLLKNGKKFYVGA